MYDDNGNWNQLMTEAVEIPLVHAMHSLGGLSPHSSWRWVGRQKCQICRGGAAPDRSPNNDGSCGIGGRELALTFYDLDDGREPSLRYAIMAMRKWAKKQQFAFVGFCESGTPSGIREYHFHWHLLCFGHKCAIETGRIVWARHCGSAWGGQWLEDIGSLDHAQALLRAKYAAKHSSKSVANSDFLPIVRKVAHYSNREAKIC